MSVPTPAPGKPETPTDSIQHSDNPFDTIFDGENSDDEWWDKEDSIPSTPATVERVESIESNPGDNTLMVVAKPVARTSTRKTHRRYSVQKPTRDKSKGRQRKQNAKAGIRVVTNFSRNQRPLPAQQEISQPGPSRTVPQAGCFVDLASLQALGGESVQVPIAFWRSKKNKSSGKTAHEPSPEVVITPTERKVSDNDIPTPKVSGDLSPDDRPIVIGISIPSSRVAEHSKSPQTASSDASRIVRSYQRSPTHHGPNTPTIIITPAQEKSCWSPSSDGTASAVDSSRTSSVYSQPSYNALGFYTDKDAPPLPHIPTSVLDDEWQRMGVEKSCFSPDSDEGTTFSGDVDNETPNTTTRSRASFACTIFEEDESPILAKRARALSISTESKAAKHASVSTVATRRRSKGWWNYITTPFLTRSNTVTVPDTNTQEPPALPSLSLAAEKVQHTPRDDKMWEKQFSPLTPETTTSVSGISWQDEPAGGHPKYSTEQTPVLQDVRHKAQESSGSIPIVSALVGDLGHATVSSPPAKSQAELTPLAREPSSQFSPIDRGVPILFNTPATRKPQSYNPFVQLTDLFRAPDTEQPQAQPIQTVIVEAPAQRDHSPQPPPYSPPKAHIPRYRAIFPPGHALNLLYPASPGPLSPGMQQAMSSGGAIPLSEVPLTPAARRPINLNSGYPALPARNSVPHFTVEHLQQPSRNARKAEAKRRRYEKEDAIARRAGGWWRGRGCIPDRGCYGRSGAEGRKRRRCYCGLILAFLFMIILIVVLATTLHRKSTVVTQESQWLNLTGFPPIFLGLSTVAAPVNIKADTGCVFPATLWSCDLPKEQQASVAPSLPNQPNFLLQIQWDNSSAANSTFANVTGNPNLGTRGISNPVSAGQFIKKMLLKVRQAVTFTPSPSPPSYAEEFFLGNTTDGVVSLNKAGESTPFYITFLSTTNYSATSSKLLRRDDSNDSDPFPNITAYIPAPSLSADGTAAPANLLPFPVQQPIRLYDRGLPTERYSFYNYFDRSIFLKSVTPLNASNLGDGEVPDDEDGGATEAEALFRCTWSQTRFLVEMWTRMNSTAELNNQTASSTVSSTTDTTIEFTQPGTFPYPITITLDRHGGDPELKLVYCYEMNDREGIISGSGKVEEEDRGFGGTLINPAPSVFVNTSDPALGGYDGGTGGCSCQWTNFESVVQA